MYIYNFFLYKWRPFFIWGLRQLHQLVSPPSLHTLFLLLCLSFTTFVLYNNNNNNNNNNNRNEYISFFFFRFMNT